MAAKIIYSNEVTEGKFLDITVPDYSMFKIYLSEKINIGTEKKTNKEVSRVYDYNLRIDASLVDNGLIEELSKNLKDLFGLSFAPYEWGTKTYKYFTTRYQEESVKKSRLVQIFDYLQEFDMQYTQKIAPSLEVFKEDSISKASYKDYDIAVKFHEKTNTFVVLSLKYFGGEKYSTLSKASMKKGKLSEAPFKPDFFADLVPEEELKYQVEKRDPSYFMFTPGAYIHLKTLIETTKQEVKEFHEHQAEVVKTFKEDDIPEYTKPNIFDFKIELDRKSNCFKFFCKGYNRGTNPETGYPTDRSLLALWAVNFFVSEPLTAEEAKLYPEKFLKHEDGEQTREGYYKIPLEFVNGSSKKNKDLILPATDLGKMQKIYNNFMEYEELFTRPQKVIKIVDNDFLDEEIKRHPAIFFDDKGETYFIYGYRKIPGNQSPLNTHSDNFMDNLTSPTNILPTEVDISEVMEKKMKIKAARLPSINMRGVQITFAEAENFLNNHPWAETIKKNTVIVNTEIWMQGEHANFGVTPAQREEMFEQIYFNSKLQNETKVKKSKVKKVKI